MNEKPSTNICVFCGKEINLDLEEYGITVNWQPICSTCREIKSGFKKKVDNT